MVCSCCSGHGAGSFVPGLLSKYGAGGVVCRVRSSAVSARGRLFDGSRAVLSGVFFAASDTGQFPMAAVAGVPELLASVALSGSFLASPCFNYDSGHAEEFIDVVYAWGEVRRLL